MLEIGCYPPKKGGWKVNPVCTFVQIGHWAKWTLDPMANGPNGRQAEWDGGPNGTLGRMVNGPNGTLGRMVVGPIGRWAEWA